MPVKPVARVSAPGVAPAPKEDYLAEERQAATQKAGIEGQQSDSNVATLESLSRDLQANAIKQNEMQAKAAADSHAQLAEIQKARDEMKSVDTKIDDGRWWSSRSVPGKISAIIGLVLGAVGSGNDGVNRAASLMDQMVSRDIESQKSEHEIALRKGQANVTAAENIYGLHRQQGLDDMAALTASKGTAYDLAKNQVDLAAARTGNPMAKANLTALSAELGRKKDAADAATKQQGFDNSIKAMNAQSDRIRALKEGAGAGAGTQAATQALLATVQTEEGTIKQQGEKLKALIQKYGTAELTGPAEAEMRQAVDNMATAAAKLKDPNSAARPSEVEMEAKNIFKPGFMQSAKTAAAQIDSYMANADQRRALAFSARGQQVPGATTAPAAGGPQVGEIRENSKTKKRIKWTGSEWAAL
jgi:hypothetical protein